MRRPPLFFLATLALAVACSGGGGGGNSPTAPMSNGVVTVEIHDDFFSPKSVTVAPGQTVRWVLVGSDYQHTVTELDGRWDSGFRFTSSGATFAHTFGNGDDGMTFQYYCKTHRGCCQMQGSVRVGSTAPPPPPGY